MSKGGGSSPGVTIGPMQPFAPSGTPSQGIQPPAFVAAPAASNPNLYTQAAQNMTQATNNVAGGTGLMASGAAPIAAGMGTYQNPYENQVMDQFQNDLARQTAMQQTQNQAAAANAGAFGGSRQGLVEAQTNEAAQRNLGTFSANLRNQGFNQMANLANQDIQNRMTAGGGLFAGASLGSDIAGQQFGIGQDIADQQFRQGAVQQGMNQMLLDDARQMFQQYTNQPQNLLDLRSSAASLSPLNQMQSQTSSYTPGLFDYISLAANMKGQASAPTGGGSSGGSNVGRIGGLW